MLIMQFVRLAAHYRTLVCCLLLMWAVCTILGTLYLTSWSKSVMSGSADQHYADIQHLLRARALFNSHNPKIARVLKYCSPLLGGGEAEEVTTQLFLDLDLLKCFHLFQTKGLGIPGSTLETVIVVTRHGDRGPLEEFVNLTAIKCSVNRTKDVDYAKFVAHMKTTATMKQRLRSSRDPFQQFSAVPRGGNTCLPGQLSEWGALQQLRTGRLLRKAYGTHPIFQKSNDSDIVVVEIDPVTVISTLYERTYQSAVAFVYGFLPKFDDFARVTFKVGQSSSLCYSQQYCRCPLVDKLRYLVERDKHEYVTSHPAVQNLLEKLNKVLLPSRRVADAHPDAIFDQLLVFVCHETSLPCHDEMSCVTVDQLNNLVSFIEWRGKLLAKSSRIRLLSRLSAQGLLIDILGKMESVRLPKKKKKARQGLVLFSAHDITLMPLLVILGVYDGTRPPFSSRLVLELYSRPSTSDQGNGKVFHLRILYNGRDVTKRVVFCEHAQHVLAKEGGETTTNATATTTQKNSQALCLLDSFAQFVNDDYLKELNVSSFHQACGGSTSLK